MKRVVIPELLDSDSGTAAEVAGTLSDLRMFNRWFGGVGTMRSLLRRAIAASGTRSPSLLEVASGDGYLPALMQRELDGQCRLRVTLLDRSPAHFNGSRARRLAADALALPFADASFDFVCSSLFVHHLEPEQVIAFIEQCLRVARTAVLIHDLRRDPVHLALAYAGFPLYRSRITRNDAPASVRRAYTTAEMQAMLRRTTAARFEIEHHFLCRMGVIAWKDGAAG